MIKNREEKLMLMKYTAKSNICIINDIICTFKHIDKSQINQ